MRMPVWVYLSQFVWCASSRSKMFMVRNLSTQCTFQLIPLNKLILTWWISMKCIKSTDTDWWGHKDDLDYFFITHYNGKQRDESKKKCLKLGQKGFWASKLVYFGRLQSKENCPQTLYSTPWNTLHSILLAHTFTRQQVAVCPTQGYLPPQ